jgi:AcrR family transcriptional regulator
MPAIATAELTRDKILKTAYGEFYQNGFQGGSLNRIITDAGIAKGALFHHFRGKQDLGYHVVDEVIRPYFQTKWVSPLLHSKDPIRDIKRIMLTTLKEDSEMLCKGCPLNNLAQEMSPLDEGFRTRINLIYDEWRSSIAQAFKNGIEQGNVRKDASPRRVSAFIVSALSGMVGTAKTAQSLQLLTASAEAMFGYLESLRP